MKISQIVNHWFLAIKNIFVKPKDDRTQLLKNFRWAHRQGIINVDILTMVEGVFQVDEMRVRDIMLPRSQLVVVRENMKVEDMLTIVSNSGHSRFPVVDETLDKVVGILLAKDLAHYYLADNREKFELNDVMRNAIFVPESKRLNVLLKDFRSSRNHMAIVSDEYGGVAGVVTIEDVLEQIVGDIDDEHDAADIINIQLSGLQRYNVRGLTPIEEFNQYFNTKLSEEKFETIAGLVTHAFGHLPERGEEVSIEGFHFKVTNANSRRLRMLQVSSESTETLNRKSETVTKIDD